jgi:predicted NodU family carbamoyl transferase
MSSILAFKPGHDGSVAAVRDGALEFSLEAEKDSFPRFAAVTPSVLLDALAWLDAPPAVVAVGGWTKGLRGFDHPLEAGYHGRAASWRESRLLGHPVRFFSSTHERSHIYGTYAMSPFEQGRPCYLLLWEGTLGSFYEIDERVVVTHLGAVLDEPGTKYGFLYSLADPSYQGNRFQAEVAGKLMALAAFSDRSPMNPAERATVDAILGHSLLRGTTKTDLRWSPYHDIGVEHPAFKALAGKFSDALFDAFYGFARANLTKGHPLLIGGGCGLNCEWNSKWRDCGLFADVFIPPVANDSGSAIGTAADAQFHLTGRAKIRWDVYAGSPFVADEPPPPHFRAEPLDYARVADFLAAGRVIAWVRGRCELGPRALGHRSLLAAPFEAAMHRRLNAIKGRELFRPIAPVCRLEEVSDHFDWEGPSPFMLHFQRVKDPNLNAVTHVDGSARVQTVDRRQEGALHALLTAFRARTGYGVLCNTSLNFKGCGFINRMSDLARFAQERRLDGCAVGDVFYRNESETTGGA